MTIDFFGVFKRLQDLEAKVKEVEQRMTAQADALAALQTQTAATVAELNTLATAVLAAAQKADANTATDDSAQLLALATQLKTATDAAVVATTPAPAPAQ